ncbi:MAG: hypothetical protein EOO73_01685 [Myxococcales bacterium]|nr:MAG: hypothetical protein EOO73_01685 [Myxococcales bacterium]
MSAPVNLGAVEELIARRRDELIINHDFMRRLEGEATLESLRRLLPRLAFFTFAFQDMLKVARDRCTDPVLAPIVASMEENDRGHDQWYVEDLKAVGIELDARALFAAECDAVRRVSYSIISLLESGTSDHERLAVLLSLEAAAREFFVRVPSFARRAGLTTELRYFGGMHLQAEEAHEVFAAETQETLNALAVPEQARQAVSEIVEKTFVLLLRLATALAGAMEGPRPPDAR